MSSSSMSHDSQSLLLAPVLDFLVHPSVGAHSLLDLPHERPLPDPRPRDWFGRLAEPPPSFCHDESQRGKAKMSVEPLALPILHLSRRRQAVGRMLRKVDLPEEAFPPERSSRIRARSVSQRLSRIHRVIVGFLPIVTDTKPKKAEVMARDVLFHIQKKKKNRRTKDETSGSWVACLGY